MSDELEKKPEESAGIAISKTLFAKLTETVLQNCKTRKDATDFVIAVGNWSSIIFASLIIMVEGKDQQGKMMATVDRITLSMNNDIKKHVVLLRGMSNKAKGVEPNRIIVPDHLKE